jgi:hypothetical protein
MDIGYGRYVDIWQCPEGRVIAEKDLVSGELEATINGVDAARCDRARPGCRRRTRRSIRPCPVAR